MGAKIWKYKKVLEDLFRLFIFMSIYVVVCLENEKVVEGDLFGEKSAVVQWVPPFFKRDLMGLFEELDILPWG